MTAAGRVRRFGFDHVCGKCHYLLRLQLAASKVSDCPAVQRREPHRLGSFRVFIRQYLALSVVTADAEMLAN
jgi:hypothetical protein